MSNEPSDRVEQVVLLREQIQEDHTVIKNNFDIMQDLLTSDKDGVRDEATFILRTVAMKEPEILEPVFSDLGYLLSDESRQVRVRAAQTLQYVSEEFPEAMLPSTEPLHDSLSDESAGVRRASIHALENLAAEMPEAINVQVFRHSLTDSDAETQVKAVTIARYLSETRPSELKPLLFELRECLSADVQPIRKKALRTLTNIGESEPEMVGVLVHDVKPLLTSDNAKLRLHATDMMCLIAENHPAEALEAKEEMRPLLQSDYEKIRLRTAIMFGNISRHDPAALADIVEDMQPVLHSNQERCRVEAAWVIANIAGENPSAAVPATDDLCSLLDDEDTIRRGVTRALHHIATEKEHVDAVVPYIEDVSSHLYDDDYETQVGAAFTLGWVGMEYPEKVRTQADTSQLLGILDAYDHCSDEFVMDVQQALHGDGDDGPMAGEMHQSEGEAMKFVTDDPEIDFDDYVGMDTLKQEARNRIVNPLDEEEIYEQFGVDIQRGFLFYGPPGTGKTYFAKALGGECDFSYMQINAADLVSKYIGEGARNVKQMFNEARQQQPCLIFIDEIDALASDREDGNQQTKSERQMVNQLLQSLTEINDQEDDIVVVGATNTIDAVDDAILRSGRLGEKIKFELPESKTRVEVFKAHLKPELDGVDVDWLATETDGFTQSNMEKVADEASLAALNRYKQHSEEEVDARVTQGDVEMAVRNVKERVEIDESDDDSPTYYFN